MKWKRPFMKAGSLRKQFSTWKIPEEILRRAKISDGDRCRISISVEEYNHAGTYLITSGGEFRVQRLVRDHLTELSLTMPQSEIEFSLFKGRCLGDEDVEFNREVAESRRLSGEERKKRLEIAPKKPRTRKVTISEFIRNPDVVAEVLERAGGVCEECKGDAPFLRASDQTPYLEVHHRRRLADGGDDCVENALALCPNCHRRSHYGYRENV